MFIAIIATFSKEKVSTQKKEEILPKVENKIYNEPVEEVKEIKKVKKIQKVRNYKPISHIWLFIIAILF